MKAESVTYIIEQKFPSGRGDGTLEWYESGEDYTEKRPALDRLRELKRSGRTGIRVVRKTVVVEIIQSI